MAWSIIPNDWNIPLFGSYGWLKCLIIKKKITSDPKNIYIAKVFSSISELHSWHIFIAIFAIPPLASGLAMVSLPESPKFLMSRGRNDEALEVFKKIYSMNTGKSPDTYPVIWLFDTISTFR